MTMLDAALTYLNDYQLPLVIIPAGEKGPRTTDWQNHVPKEEEVRARIAEKPDTNLGLNLTQSDLAAVDYDTTEQEQVYDELFGDIQTWCFKSPHGGQYFFKGKSRLAPLATAVYNYRGLGFRLGLDGKGAQSVLPPSVTDGMTREWINPPGSCPVADIPASVIELLLADHQARQTCESQADFPDNDFLVSNSPGDDYCRRGTWAEILQPHGWTLAGSCDGTEYWCRPDKDKGVSGTTYCKSRFGRDLFYCFTTNAPPLAAETTYSKFALFAVLNHDGDFKVAAAELAEKGYGRQTPEAICVSCGAVRGRGIFTFNTVAQAKEAAKKLGFPFPEISVTV